MDEWMDGCRHAGMASAWGREKSIALEWQGYSACSLSDPVLSSVKGNEKPCLSLAPRAIGTLKIKARHLYSVKVLHSCKELLSV